MKKVLFRLVIVLIATFLVLAVAVPSYAEDNTLSNPSGSCGENVSWFLDISTGNFLISGTGAMVWYDITPWNSYKDLITSVTVSDGVTSVSHSSFENCTSLKTVTIGADVLYIKSDAFSGCKALESVTFSGNSALQSIESSAFYYCQSLRSIRIPNSVITIDSMAFYGCNALEDVTFEKNSRLSTVSSYAFGYCSFESIEIPKSVERINSNAFASTVKTFIFCGTMDEWYAIRKEDRWASSGDYSVSYHGYQNPCDTTCIYCGHVRTQSHTFSHDCSTVCSACGETRAATASHSYEFDCSAICKVCGETRNASHVYGAWTEIIAPTENRVGEKERTCSVCGRKESEIIPKLISNDTVANSNNGCKGTVVSSASLIALALGVAIPMLRKKRSH